MKESIFLSAFVDNWKELPYVIRQHYQNCTYSNDSIITEGAISIEFGYFFTFLKPFFWIFNAFPLRKASNIPIIVRFFSKKDSSNYYIQRIFSFSQKKRYVFNSYMMKMQNNKFAEFIKFGIGRKFSFECCDNGIKMHHEGYVLKIFNKIVALPINFILGTISVQEVALSESKFSISMTIKHSLLGILYSYYGEFITKKISHD
jgi:hypothetical protein